MPKEPQYTFYASDSRKGFEIENREALAELQNLGTLQNYSRQFEYQKGRTILEMFSDFHVLLFLRTNETCNIGLDSLKPLLKAVKEQDRTAASEWMNSCGDWATLLHLMDANAASGGAPLSSDVNMAESNGPSGDPDIQEIPAPSPWACAHCTFENPATNRDCEMCGLPKS